MEFLSSFFRRHFGGKPGSVAKCRLYFQATCTKKPLGSNLHSYSYCNNCYIFFPREILKTERRKEKRKKEIHKKWHGMEWKFDHISQAIKSLNWLPVNDRIYLNDAVMMYKCINKLVPDYLFEKFTLRSQIHTRNTRQRDQLNIPRCRLTTGQRSFTYRGAKLWNNLRDNVKSSDSVKVFRKKIVNLLFSDQSMNL